MSRTRSSEPIDLGARQHGTNSGYTGGCGCELCLLAHRAYGAGYQSGWRLRTGRTKTALPSTPAERELYFLACQEHGTPGRYEKGCHCDACSEAMVLRQRQYRETGSTKGYRTRPERRFINLPKVAA